MQLKDLLEQRKAELTANYERLLTHIVAIRKQVSSDCVCWLALLLVLLSLLLLLLSKANLTDDKLKQEHSSHSCFECIDG